MNAICHVTENDIDFYDIWGIICRFSMNIRKEEYCVFVCIGKWKDRV